MNSATKRLQRELIDLQREAQPFIAAYPLDDNLFEWHFTIKGPLDAGFAGGLYHGKILFPNDYPFSPPSILLLTPNGRFELNKKICLSITSHHPEFWRPAWGILTALTALIGFFPSKGEGAIGALDYTETERAILARKSHNWKCLACGKSNSDAFPIDQLDTSITTHDEAAELAQIANNSITSNVQSKDIASPDAICAADAVAGMSGTLESLEADGALENLTGLTTDDKTNDEICASSSASASSVQSIPQTMQHKPETHSIKPTDLTSAQPIPPITQLLREPHRAESTDLIMMAVFVLLAVLLLSRTNFI